MLPRTAALLASALWLRPCSSRSRAIDVADRYALRSVALQAPVAFSRVFAG
jgi:hypothetical protein